jgi:AraC family transcriptional regulator, regulatory protein of adaptative response / DNA-3-methyladenine glycosylase II
MHNETFERARLARDARFDGRFYIGVRTTGIYCRPICPATSPKRENVLFFPSAAAAGEAGFRPCLRCRPECVPGTPAWAGTSTTVRRGLRLIDSGALDEGNVESLAERLGVTSRHLRRLFNSHLGASPLAVAHTRRLHFAKRLLDDSALPMSDIAIAAGYGSTRRFNDAFKKAYDRSPRELRRVRERAPAASGTAPLTVRLPYRPPYRWRDVLRFYGLRAIPGVETIDGDVYRRALAVGDAQAIIEVRPHDRDGFLEVGMREVPAARVFEVVQAVRQVFDTDAPINDIADALRGDPRLAALLKRQPGVRVPGAFDGFELAVRAILGQQISVRAATTIAGRIAVRYGTPLSAPCGALTHLFPVPEQLRRARFNNIGLVRSRADTLRRLAAAVAGGDIGFHPLQDLAEFHAALTAIKGIGDWTAQYVMMRALKHPDAFPAADLGLMKGLEPGVRVSAKQLAARADDWRPWRAYAAMLLWGADAAGGGG